MLDDVLDVGCSLLGSAARHQLLDPARIQVDVEQRRIEPGCHLSLELAEHVRAGRSDEQEAAVTQRRLVEVGGKPGRHLFDPVAQEDHPLRDAGGSAALVNHGCGRCRAVAGWHHVANRHLAQFIDDIWKQGQILERLDVGEGVEVQRLGAV